MNTNVTVHDALVDNYLRAVGQALAGVPAYRRDELLPTCASTSRPGGPSFGEDETEADVRSLLDQLGDPAEVAAEAAIDAAFGPGATVAPHRRRLQLQPSKRVGAAVWVLIASSLCAMLCVGALVIGLFAFSRGGSDGGKTPAPAPIITATAAPTPSAS